MRTKNGKKRQFLKTLFGNLGSRMNQEKKKKEQERQERQERQEPKPESG